MRPYFSILRATLSPFRLLLALFMLGAVFPAVAGDLPPIFLHATGALPALTLDTSAPTATTPKVKDSAGVAFSGGNPWREIGTWTAASPPFTETVSGFNPLHVFVGLKNGDDQGARFDLSAEIYKNGALMASGENRCVTGVTVNPDKAQEVIIPFSVSEGTLAPSDVLSLKVRTRVGTTATGAFCGGHVSAIGLRLYFDAVSRPARIEGTVASSADWNTGVGGNPDRASLSGAMGPAASSVLWHAGIPAVFGQQAVTDGDALFSTRSEAFGSDGSWVVAQDLNTGAELWRTKLPINFGNSWYSRVSAARGGHVYATRAGNTNLEYIYALNAVDGSILWQSQDLTDEYGPESLSFAENDDLIVGNFRSLIRVNHVNGNTVWKTPHLCPTSGGCAAAVAGDHVYVWDVTQTGSVLNLVVSAFDTVTGNKLYSSAPLSQGGFTIEQIGVVAGPNGAVYAPMANNSPADSFVALQDTGSALTEEWRIPMAWVPFASFGVASDATVYTYSVARQIQRLDPASGAVLNRSMPIPFDSAAFTPRIAIDSVGRVFLTNGGVSDGALYSFNADLTLRWSDGVRGVTLGGTALHHDGTLLVCGFDGVRAYRNSSSQGTVVGSTSNGIADIRETPDISSGAATVPGGVRPKGPPQHQMPLGAGHAPLLTVQGGAEMADPLVSPSSDCH